MLTVGVISQRMADVLQLDVPAGTEIFLGESNIQHMKTAHPEDYEMYGDKISEIIAKPTYVGINPKDGSLEYVRLFGANMVNVKLAVRPIHDGKYYAKTLYSRTNYKLKRLIEKGYLLEY